MNCVVLYNLQNITQMHVDITRIFLMETTVDSEHKKIYMKLILFLAVYNQFQIQLSIQKHARTHIFPKSALMHLTVSKLVVRVPYEG